MILRIFTIYLCVGLIRGAEDNNLSGENGSEEKEKSSIFDGIEQLRNNSGEFGNLRIGYQNPTINFNGTGNGTNVNNSTNQVACLKNSLLGQTAAPVQIVNSTYLASFLQVEPNITSRQTPAQCVAVLFFSPTCPFSCLAAPHYNALPYCFPDIKMFAIDALTHRAFNAQYGIFGIPTLILFHNGKPAATLNTKEVYNLALFLQFIQNNTNLEPENMMYISMEVARGPINSVPVYERDYYLLLSWLVIIIQLLYSFYRSSWGRWLVDTIQSAWREAEAQHHHMD